MGRVESVRMSDVEVAWVRERMGYDAATNHADLGRVDHWLVEGHAGGVEVYDVVGSDLRLPKRDGFPLDGDFDEVVAMLRSTGFPMSDF